AWSGSVFVRRVVLRLAQPTRRGGDRPAARRRGAQLASARRLATTRPDYSRTSRAPATRWPPPTASHSSVDSAAPLGESRRRRAALDDERVEKPRDDRPTAGVIRRRRKHDDVPVRRRVAPDDD